MAGSGGGAGPPACLVSLSQGNSRPVPFCAQAALACRLRVLLFWRGGALFLLSCTSCPRHRSRCTLQTQSFCRPKPAHASTLACVLCRAHDRGFRLVLLYEPEGSLKQGPLLRRLELQLLHRRLHSTVRLQAGWQLPPGPPCPGLASANEPGTAEAGYGCDMRVVLLAAADGQWPLLAAAAGGTADTVQAGSAQGESSDEQDGTAAEGSSALDAAIAAPARVRQRLAAAAGPLAAAEPDFVLVGAGRLPARCVQSLWRPVAWRIGLCMRCWLHACFQYLHHSSFFRSAQRGPVQQSQGGPALFGPSKTLTSPYCPPWAQVTGPALTLAGFPPWAVRASEMYSIGPLASLHGDAELEGALRRFCGTKQRWGK